MIILNTGLSFKICMYIIIMYDNICESELGRVTRLWGV